MTNLWNNGNNELSEYQDMTDIYSQAGACLGIGINNAGLIDDSDPAFALLSDSVNHKE
jgi:26S proteasome regulatory subunit N1